ncbi:carbohydrate kinase family protein [Anaerostipes sp. MSJ-23]|uniref:carbohydrate kinase family protein n=2 Tax=unclassified Anaerostipes TaxID=2635253 RepID=UPI001C110B8A|nr:carbohydrate kinase [Anaerostipes sp. MSJ-23]MBU5459991.1 carbohydrate kinase [Anaerostipes sp. MSJ-23]
MKNKLCGIGEALIDFIPEVKGQRLKDVPSFTRVAGGAPANVVGAVTKLGIPSKFLTKLGDDPFGDYIVEVLDQAGIDTSNIERDQEGETALAFVSLAADGNRDFKFYRKNSADLRYNVEDIPTDVLDDCGMIHFCSVDLVESPMKQAHKKLIDMAIAQNVKVSFDPNLRFSLWDDLDQLKETVNEFLDYADIIKISDEELEFITGYTDIKDAVPGLLSKRAKYVVYTKGKDGAEVYTKDGVVEASGYTVDVRDTTGAGDSFIGAFLYCLLRDEVEDLNSVSKETLHSYLDFANAYAANTTTKEGALAAMADAQEVEAWMAQLKK